MANSIFQGDKGDMISWEEVIEALHSYTKRFRSDIDVDHSTCCHTILSNLGDDKCESCLPLR